MNMPFEEDIVKCLEVLKRGGVILYPTDTVWGLGCDATNEEAVKRIYHIKQRADSKSMIILLADPRDILRYVAAPDPAVFDFIEQQTRPTTIIYEHALGLPENLVGADGSIGIRLVADDFCRHLVKRFRKPVVSTSANISGSPAPSLPSEISPLIRGQVDYAVRWRSDDNQPASPSRVVKWHQDGSVEIIRS